MRIYAVADIHGKKNKIAEIKEVILKKTPDLLVIAGDIFNFTIPQKILTLLLDIKLPILGVRGNSDMKFFENKIKTKSPVTLLDASPFAINDLSFVGLNGTIVLPFITRISFNESGCLKPLKNVITPKTVLVAHPPPYGICDRVANRFSAGSVGLRTLIENHPPLMVLCGHIHEQAGFQYLNDTLIVNCAMNKTYSGAIIDYMNDTPIKINMIKT